MSDLFFKVWLPVAIAVNVVGLLILAAMPMSSRMPSSTRVGFIRLPATFQTPIPQPPIQRVEKPIVPPDRRAVVTPPAETPFKSKVDKGDPKSLQKVGPAKQVGTVTGTKTSDAKLAEGEKELVTAINSTVSNPHSSVGNDGQKSNNTKPLETVAQYVAQESRSARHGKIPGYEYPKSAIDNGWHGRVRISAAIDSRGNIISPQVIQSSGYSIIDNAAMRYIKTWNFSPALIGGKPVDDQVILEAIFEHESVSGRQIQ